jgi:tetratricopeptide (TPR) repeat protein
MRSFGQRLGTTRFAADDAYRRALEALARRDYDQAHDLVTEAIEALPTHAEYYAARGLIHLEEAEYDQAQADFEAALHLFAHEMLAHFGLGAVAFRRDKDYARAVQHFLAAHYDQPERPETLFWLAVSYYYAGDVVNAANFMARADARFEQLNDKRRAETQRWIKELGKHAARPAKPAPAAQPLPSPQARLPLPPEESG